MPNLLMVTTVPSTLGFLTPFAVHFRRKGWRVDALSGPVRPPEQVEGFGRCHEIVWSRNPVDPRNLLAAPARVREVVRAGDYDIVHVHTPVAAFVTRFALRARSARPRVVYTAHGFHFHALGSAARNAAYVALEKLAARWTDDLVVINREDADAARRLRLVPEERLWPMPGIGVDPACYSPERVTSEQVRAVRESLGLGADRVVLMVAEFIPRKRHGDALRAFALLGRVPGTPRTHLLLAGAGPLTRTIQELARQLGVADRVHFLGVRGDVPLLMRASTALLLPSDQEGLPRVVLEAMCMGLPVIGARIRGTAELLEEGCGWLHAVGDAAGLAAALRIVLLDPAAAAVAVRRARERVARYDERAVIELHEALYAEALGEASARIPRAASVP